MNEGFPVSGSPVYCTLHLFPPMLCHDAVEVLGPCRPAFDPPWMLVTVLVAQHGGLAGRVGARGMPWVVTPRHHMAFQGGLEGRGGVALMDVVIPVRDFSDEFIVPFLHFCISIACMLEM